jgi:hypothetical protein
VEIYLNMETFCSTIHRKNSIVVIWGGGEFRFYLEVKRTNYR